MIAFFFLLLFAVAGIVAPVGVSEGLLSCDGPCVVLWTVIGALDGGAGSIMGSVGGNEIGVVLVSPRRVLLESFVRLSPTPPPPSSSLVVSPSGPAVVAANVVSQRSVPPDTVGSARLSPGGSTSVSSSPCCSLRRAAAEKEVVGGGRRSCVCV